MQAQDLPPFMVERAKIDCDINNLTLFDGNTQAQCIATNVFSDDFNTYIDKTNEELDDDF
jgi:hypothetical protein